jgi:hypothetical protein
MHTARPARFRYNTVCIACTMAARSRNGRGFLCEAGLELRTILPRAAEVYLAERAGPRRNAPPTSRNAGVAIPGLLAQIWLGLGEDASLRTAYAARPSVLMHDDVTGYASRPGRWREAKSVGTAVRLAALVIGWTIAGVGRVGW